MICPVYPLILWQEEEGKAAVIYDSMDLTVFTL